MSELTNLHQPSALGILEFLRAEMDAGRIAALSVVAVSRDRDVFRESWIAPSGAALYTLAGGLAVEQREIERKISDE